MRRPPLRNLNIFITALAAMTMLLADLPARAATPTEEATVTWYDVEIVVFRNLDTRSSETWPPDAGVPNIADARPLFPPPAEPGETNETLAQPEPATLSLQPTDYPQAPTPYEPLDASAMHLTDIANSLQRSSKYEPLVHTGWTQPPLERAQAPYMRVTLPDAFMPQEEPAGGQQAYGDSFYGEQQAQEETLTEENEIPLESVPEFLAEDDGVVPARPLDGIVQLSVSRYLHLDLDLLYLPADLNVAVLGGVEPAREWTEEEKREREQRRRDILEALARGDISVEEAEILAMEPDEQRFQGFRLNQYRRMRSREVHYFDHPVFGVIVTVTPREVSARTMELDAGTPGQ